MSLIPIYMPKFGMTMEEGLIVEWLVAEGDSVAEGDGIVVIETEKVSTEVESPAGGVVVELSCEVDDEVPVGQVIGYIESA
ncbi:MAG: biotin attachment protein [Chloroflexi bacterium]|nr:biotin attachment protein [Chloroflexota bacterium]